MNYWIRWAATIGAIAVGCICAWSSESPQAERPNILLINVDDLDVMLFEEGRAGGVFPNLDRLAREGLLFDNCHVTSPLCGPSRASLLTGRYLFGHGVRSHSRTQSTSNGFRGGYSQYRGTDPEIQPGDAIDWTQGDLSVLAGRAGYRTMLVGKYLHDDFTPEPGRPWSDVRPIGWDDFYASMGGKYFETTRYMSRRDGHYQEEAANLSNLNLENYPMRYHPWLRSGYRTNVECIDAIRLIEDQVQLRPEQPFMLYLAPFAPHKPSSGLMLDTRYQNWWQNKRQPWAPDYNLSDVTGKPSAIASLPALDAARMEAADQEYRQRMLAMKSLDDMLGLLLDRLEELSVLDQTLIIFTSDNGYMLGQQRFLGKQLPYDRCTRVPLVVWGPGWGVPSGQTRSHLVSHVDLLPTILDFGRATPMIGDGRSLRELLVESGNAVDPATWRMEGVLSEHYQTIVQQQALNEGVYHSLRLYDQRYTRWADGFVEYYDLATDPWERFNRIEHLSSGEQHLFETILQDLRSPAAPYQATITSPRFSGETFYRRRLLSGYAEARSGVSEVRLVISRRELPGQASSPVMYFDGRNWQPSFTQIRARLEAPNASVTGWTYDFFPRDTGEYRVDVTARIYDRNGGVQPQVVHRWLTMDNQAPATAITQPAFSTGVGRRNQSQFIRGWAKGELAIKEIRLVIRDRDTGLYFDGTRWLPGYRYIVTDSYSPTDPTYRVWEGEIPPQTQPRRVVVTARAYQVDGTFDQSVPVARIELR